MFSWVEECWKRKRVAILTREDVVFALWKWICSTALMGTFPRNGVVRRRRYWGVNLWGFRREESRIGTGGKLRTFGSVVVRR